MTDDHDTDEYRVKTNQPGRATKPVAYGRDSNGILRAQPGETFEVPAGTDLSAFEDRVVPVGTDAAEQDAADSTPDADAGSDPDPDPEPEAQAEPEPQAVDAAAADAADGDGDDDGDESEDAADDSEPVNPANVAERLGYDDCDNVDEVRATVRDADLTDREKRALVRYEGQHDDRKTAKEAIRDA